MILQCGTGYYQQVCWWHKCGKTSQIVIMLSREACTNWKNMLVGISWSSKEKCAKFCTWGEETPCTSVCWVQTSWKTACPEKDIGVLLNTKMNINKQCAKFVAKRSAGILGCIRRKVLLAGWRNESFFSSALSKPNLEHWVQFWTPLYKRDVNILERSTSGHEYGEGVESSLLREKKKIKKRERENWLP